MGRILRTIDKFKGHYGEDLIDSAYIYTNDPEFKLSENNNIPTRINTHSTTVKEKYKNIAKEVVLPASHFEKKPPIIKGNNLIKALQSKISDFFIAQNNSIIDEKISREQLDENTMDVKETIWNKDNEISRLETKRIDLSPVEIEKKYEKIIKRIYSPFSPMILEALDNIATELNIDLQEFYKYVISNEDSYVKAIKSAIESIRDKETINYQYSIPSSVTLSNQITSSEKYLYNESPLKHNNSLRNTPEEKMIGYLDDNDNVIFWFKNIERQPDAFCIAYDNTGGTEKNDNFYPDFIVLDKNHHLWILETKGGENSDIDKKTPEKYIGIQNYLKAHKNSILIEGKISDLTFSIVRPVGNTLKIFAGEDYKKSLTDSRWRDLII